MRGLTAILRLSKAMSGVLGDVELRRRQRGRRCRTKTQASNIKLAASKAPRRVRTRRLIMIAPCRSIFWDNVPSAQCDATDPGAVNDSRPRPLNRQPSIDHQLCPGQATAATPNDRRRRLLDTAYSVNFQSAPSNHANKLQHLPTHVGGPTCSGSFLDV